MSYRYYDPGAGAQFLLRTGKYYGGIDISSNWTKGTGAAPIIVAAYGDGEVIIDASIANTLGAWSVYSGSIYQSTLTTVPSPNSICAVVIDGDFRDYLSATNLAGVTGPGLWFYDSTAHVLYVWAVGGVNPTGHDIVVIKTPADGSYDSAVSVDYGQNYVTFSNLTLRGSDADGIYIAPYGGVVSDHITFTRCKIEFNGKAGIWAQSTTNLELSKNYWYGNVLTNWPLGTWNSNCSDSLFGWAPTVSIVSNSNAWIHGNIVDRGCGEGIIFLGDATSGSNLAEYNIVRDAFSTSMYLDHAVNCTFRDNMVISHNYANSDIKQSCSGQIAGIERKARAVGIISANEGGDGTNCGSGNSMYNNLILGATVGLGNGDETTSGCVLSNESWFSNTIIMPNFNPASYGGGTYVGISITSGSSSGVSIKNNLIIGQDSNSLLVSWAANSGVTWNDNLYYHTNNSTPFVLEGTNYGFSNWKTQTGQDANSVNSAPLLNRTDWSTLVQ
jgi:hypothetical protein